MDFKKCVKNGESKNGIQFFLNNLHAKMATKKGEHGVQKWVQEWHEKMVTEKACPKGRPTMASKKGVYWVIWLYLAKLCKTWVYLGKLG